jgi:hypothetical membrane protein
VSAESDLHFVSAIFIFFSAAIPIYLSARVGKELKSLTVALAVFIVIHGIYHILAHLQYSLSESVFEPLSVIALIVFGLMYLATRRNRLRGAIKQHG